MQNFENAPRTSGVYTLNRLKAFRHFFQNFENAPRTSCEIGGTAEKDKIRGRNSTFRTSVRFGRWEVGGGRREVGEGRWEVGGGK